jgi:glycosyltransferase involved in cell wall biosynthesis
LPAVASDIPSCRELAGDGRHLWLVSGDEPLAWSAAIRALRADDAARQALATRAAAWARENLSPAASRDAALRVYQGVISP